ncbi:MAG: type II toxin-antitoxin system VapC family toxin [Candidatus Electrothrix sp. Rat3]|nr:type II toxin-antitoxin system VapC family toxin [Candidatus Electrothrix rattekaaiensis]
MLDTHIWIRWLMPTDPLPPDLTELIETADGLAVSSISCWEVILLEKFNRIELPLPVDEWLKEALGGSDVAILSIDERIASLAARLPYHHKDPADRFIIATAIINHIELISLDNCFPLYVELTDLLITA